MCVYVGLQEHDDDDDDTSWRGRCTKQERTAAHAILYNFCNVNGHGCIMCTFEDFALPVPLLWRFGNFFCLPIKGMIVYGSDQKILIWTHLFPVTFLGETVYESV